MKNKNKHPKPTRSKFTILKQLCQLIASHMVSKLARKHGVDKKARTFSPWSHVVSMLYAQLIHAIGLNDVCDNLRLHNGPLSTIRGATAPSRNGLSHANKHRRSDLMQDLFWKILKHLKNTQSNFGLSQPYQGFPRRFRRTIHAVDSTTIHLVARCMDWARHRRRKAAARCHLRLDLQSFLPRFAIVDTAKIHDKKKAYALCAGIKSGEIVVFDKAYVDFEFLFDLQERGVFWVTRAKDNMAFRVVKKRMKKRQGNVLRDDEVVLKTSKSKTAYPQRLGMILAEVSVNGKWVKMVFISNNLQWAPQSICDLYKSRWAIEVFFKQIKQTLQLADFMGTTANAVQWQIWSAMLLYVLLRFQAFIHGWNHSFTRLFTLIRGAVWSRINLQSLLHFYGTANGHFKLLCRPDQAFLPGFG